MMDLIKHVNDLRESGFETKNAEAIINVVDKAMDDKFTTKEDMIKLTSRVDLLASELRNEINNLGIELRNEINNLGIELRNEINNLGIELRNEISNQGLELKNEIKTEKIIVQNLILKLENNLLIKMAAIGAFYTGLIIIFLKHS